MRVANGIYWVEVPGVDLYVLCGCPADSVKHLMKKGLISTKKKEGVDAETGPNAILLSDISIQNGSFANLAEFPVLQMLYRQGMILPGHPNNADIKPLLMGSEEQVRSQKQYIYRGNYGLVSEEEIMAAGESPETAREMMRLKLKFAHGKIRTIEEFFDSRSVTSDPVEIRNGVFIRRLKVNIFEFRYQGELLTVNLNLAPHESYEAPYPLGYHKIEREYFAVVHSGEGNGWDINRPCMASIIMFQGKIYLIDAGPNILYSLRSLGIGVNEIEGIFHTHAHDDHFAGLTTLMRSGHKIKYFATPLVRLSVTMKLSSLTSIKEEDFNNYFAVHDLEPDVWNEIDGLEIKPVNSPHPVETTIFLIRTLCEGGYRCYAHLADIASLTILRNMVNDNPEEPGISQEAFDRVRASYLTGVNLKKLDAGGGLIHGDAMDFRTDTSGKIILSHMSSELTNQQKEIGSGTSFGMVDVLISSYQDYLWKYAFYYLESHFPGVPRFQINMLVNNPVVTFNPESILIRKEEICNNIYLILTGDVELIRSDLGIIRMLSSGAVIGEISGLEQYPSKKTYRAVNFVQALQLPCSLYLDFIKRNGLYDDIKLLQEKREFIQNTWLFGEEISYMMQNRLANAMTLHTYEADTVIPGGERPGIHVVQEGKFQLFLKDDVFETLHAGDFFGAGNVLFGTPDIFQVRALVHSRVYHIRRDALLEIPIVHWKLFEVYEKQMRKILNPDLISIPIIQWRDEYNINIQDMDSDHRSLFEITNTLYEAISAGEGRAVLEDKVDLIISYTGRHFAKEEQLLKKYGYPELNTQRKQHERFRETVMEYKRKYASNEIDLDIDFINLLRDWIINHILTEDRKYGVYLNRQGIS